MMKKLALAILLAFSYSVYAQTVNSTTGEVQVTTNIIDPTKWNNVIPMNGTQLGQVEGTGGGPVPAFNTDTNTIRFSYFPYTVSQVIAINSALSGQGISVGGFNYSWKIYNDLENCCSTRGSLIGNVNFFNNSGKLTESYTYDYSLTNTGANFQTFAGKETFNSPYQLNSLGDISVSWTGSDINFWSGYYGPRVRDVSISLNYTVNSSPTPTKTTNTDVATTETSKEPVVEQSKETTVASTETKESTTQPVVQTNSQQAVQIVQPVVQIVSNPQQGPSLNSILSTIQSNAKREQALVSSTVSGANQAAQSAILATEQTALSVAITSSTISQQTTQQSTQSNNSTFGLAQGLPLLPSNIFSNQSNNANQISVLTPNEVTAIAQPTTQQSLGNQSSITEFRNTDSENNLFSSNFLSNRANPLTDIIENNTRTNSNTTEQKEKTLNKTAQNNELAGNVDINKMSTQPIGYNAYLQLALRDSTFYAPKEIYRNQRVIDNQQVGRLLNFASDAKHKEMVEQQYRR